MELALPVVVALIFYLRHEYVGGVAFDDKALHFRPFEHQRCGEEADSSLEEEQVTLPRHVDALRFFGGRSFLYPECSVLASAGVVGQVVLKSQLEFQVAMVLEPARVPNSRSA
jgi:hypothetical protein